MDLTTRILANSPAVWLGRRRTRNRVSIIASHGVPDRAAFARLVDELASHGSFIGPNDLREWLDGGALPPNPILLTFDDGDRSVLDNAAPVLSDRRVPALLFVITSVLDSSTPFWWDEAAALTPDGATTVRNLKAMPDDERRAALAELRSTRPDRLAQPQLTTPELFDLESLGWEIGNHTFDHPCLDRCSAHAARAQIVQGHDELARRGLRPRAFAYPNGNLDLRVEEPLRELGYDLGFLFDHRHAQAGGNPLRLSRLRLDSHAAPERARVVVSGISSAVMRARGRL